MEAFWSQRSTRMYVRYFQVKSMSQTSSVSVDKIQGICTVQIVSSPIEVAATSRDFMDRYEAREYPEKTKEPKNADPCVQRTLYLLVNSKPTAQQNESSSVPRVFPLIFLLLSSIVDCVGGYGRGVEPHKTARTRSNSIPRTDQKPRTVPGTASCMIAPPKDPSHT